MQLPLTTPLHLRVCRWQHPAVLYFHLQVFGPHAAQDEIFDTVGRPLTAEVLEGFNATIFAYGQSGTGKTYTMEGAGWEPSASSLNSTAGLIPRVVSHMFAQLAHLPEEAFTVKASFLEIYNEEIRDLLSKVRPCTAFYCVVREPFSIAGISSPCLVNQLLQPPTKVCRRRR